jgi:hypothetical protein
VFHILIQLFNITWTWLVAKGDCSIRSTWSILKRLMPSWEDSLVHLKVVELYFLHSFDFNMHMWPHDSCVHQILYWGILSSPWLRHAQNLTHAIDAVLGWAENLYLSVSI